MKTIKEDGSSPILQEGSFAEAKSEISDTISSDTSLVTVQSSLSEMDIGQIGESDPDDPADPNYTPPTDMLLEAKRKCLNELLKLDGSSKKCEFALQKDYHDYPRQQQWTFRYKSIIQCFCVLP